MEELKLLLTKSNIAYIQLVNCEADDIIASFVAQNTKKYPGLVFDIFTRDKDLLQLLNQKTNILKYIKKKLVLYTQENFCHEYNFPPSSYVDYLSLVGDNVDNVEGVKGIGPVNAKNLIQQFTTLENVYQAMSSNKNSDKGVSVYYQLINNLPVNIKNLLENSQELVFRNKKVIGLEKNLPLHPIACNFNWEE